MRQVQRLAHLFIKERSKGSAGALRRKIARQSDGRIRIKATGADFGSGNKALIETSKVLFIDFGGELEWKPSRNVSVKFEE